MSVLSEHMTQMPSSSPLRESSSSEFCASSGGHEREGVGEASSRLAARLERSEYKRSRGKRLHKHKSSSSLLGKTRSNDHQTKRKSSAPAQLHCSDAENGPDEYIKQDWENREKPFFEPVQSRGWSAIQGSDEGHTPLSNVPSRPQSWYGSSQTQIFKFVGSKNRPRSMHEVLPDKGPSQASSGTIGNIAKRPNAYTAEPYKSRSLNHYFANSDFSKTALRNEHSISMSRSLSSSISSHVGSMEERDAEHHGVYSAYDVASRSPYSGAVQRRFSQSSLSSSSASWNQSNPSLGYQTPKTSRESIHQSCQQGRTSDSHDFLERKSFVELSTVSEGGTYIQFDNTNISRRHENDIKPQEQNFSSTYSIRLTKVPISSAPILEQSITPSETIATLSSVPDAKLHSKQNPPQTAEKSNNNNKYSSKAYEGDQTDTSVKVSVEAGVFQSQNQANFDPERDSDAQKTLVTYTASELSFNQSLSHPNEYQRHNQDSCNASVIQAGMTARFYQTPQAGKSDSKPSTSPSVKDLAKKFSGYHGDEGHGDMRKVKAETWPKVVHVHNASYYENEVKKYTLYSENISLDNVSHKEVRESANIKQGTKSNPDTTNQHKANIVNSTEMQKIIVISADNSNSKSFDYEDNNATKNNLKRKHSRDFEQDIPRGVTLPTLEFNNTEEYTDISVNGVYRRNNMRNVNCIENRNPPKVPPRPKSFPAVTMKCDTSHSTQDSVKSLDNGDGISHRLSLQELIRLHEDRIATHAQSARASSHAQIYLKRPVSDLIQQRDFEEHCDDPSSGTNDHRGNAEPLHTNENNEDASKQSENLSRMDELRSPASQYKIKEVQSASRSPIKVIELSDKKKVFTDVGEMKDCSARVKRHRTIGIVGVRQQIDQATENKLHASKPKRHTTIGLVDLKGLQTDDNTMRQPVEEETFAETNVKDLQSSVQGILEDLEDLTKDKRNAEKAEPEFTDYVEKENAEKIDELCVSKREEHKSLDYETSQMFLPSLVTQDLQLLHQKQVSSSPSVTQPAQDIIVKQSSHHSFVTSSTHYKTETYSSPKHTVTERDIYEEALRDETQIFGSTKPRPSSEQVLNKPKHLPLDKQTSKQKTNESSNTYIIPKPYSSGKSIPIAQVSPVSPVQQVVLPLSETHMRRSPLSTASSAREMYEMRLALLNLVPSNDNPSPQEMLDRRLPEDNYTISASSHDRRRRRNEPFTPIINAGEFCIDPRTEGLYFQLIDQLRRENHELREKLDLEKRDWKQKYDEQKKVANAYQKLEDRYRRRVHELQDALANCTCQSLMVAKDSSILGTPITSEKLNEVGKTNNNSGLHIIDELEEWITEQSCNGKTNNVNTSHDSLISSSSEFTGMGWDYSAYGTSPGDAGQIDHVNGTHV